MKGIILAGGTGSRLYPLTSVVCKQLLPVYDKPMIYYPLSTLMLGGINDILIISTPKDTPLLEKVLGDGSQWGVKLTYKIQENPSGIAQAFILGEQFINNDNVTLILGDNIFYGRVGHTQAIAEHTNGSKKGASIFGYPVTNPQEFGVIDFDENGKALSIEEKPTQPKSHFAVPGLYIYDNEVVEISKNLKPSGRGELEITDVNMEYLRRGTLNVIPIGRGVAWLDTGTPGAMQEASSFIEIVESRQGLKIACLEEVALRKGLTDPSSILSYAKSLPHCQYRDYVEKIASEFKVPK